MHSYISNEVLRKSSNIEKDYQGDSHRGYCVKTGPKFFTMNPVFLIPKGKVTGVKKARGFAH